MQLGEGVVCKLGGLLVEFEGIVFVFKSPSFLPALFACATFIFKFRYIFDFLEFTLPLSEVASVGGMLSVVRAFSYFLLAVFYCPVCRLSFACG